MKKLILIFLSFTIYFNSFAHAANIGGWTIGALIADGASSIVNGTKTVVINGANVVKTSTARITPSVASVSKLLARGAAGYALSVAVEQLLGAVDWVLDPENNQIVYKVPPTDPNSPENQYYWESVYSPLTKSSTMQEAAQKMVKETCRVNNYKDCSAPYDFTKVNDNRYSFKYDTYYTSGGSKTVRTQYATRIANPAYDPDAEEEERTLGLDVVSQQVIDNAENSSDSDIKAGAQVATVGAAEDMLANNAATQSDVEQQLNANARTETSEQATGETKPNEANPDITDISLDFPAFCGWAPTICEAANVVINFPTTLTNWWDKSVSSLTSAYEYAKTKVQEFQDFFKEKEQDQTDTNVDVIQDVIPDLEQNIFNANDQCPPDFTYEFPLPFGGTFPISYSYATACYWFSKLYYIVVLVSLVIATKIVTGVGEQKDG